MERKSMSLDQWQQRLASSTAAAEQTCAAVSISICAWQALPIGARIIGRFRRM